MSSLQKKNILSLFLLTASIYISYAQGCSDAGFCTISPIKPNERSDETMLLRNGLFWGMSIGKGERDITIINPYIEYSRHINEKLTFNGKLTYMMYEGELTNKQGIADLYINSTYAVSNEVKAVLGIKIPMNDGNSLNNKVSLPMNYQPSLGTFDVIAGVNYNVQRFGFTLALQQPITQNSNQFIAETYSQNSIERKYQSTNKFIRKSDILLRVNYKISIANDMFEIVPSLLPIYHTGNDEYTDSNNELKVITGSKGMTLNGNLFLNYFVNEKNSVTVSYGMPFIVRDARPDGLTREYVAGLEYRFLF